jgi:hypothetical protein
MKLEAACGGAVADVIVREPSGEDNPNAGSHFLANARPYLINEEEEGFSIRGHVETADEESQKRSGPPY